MTSSALAGAVDRSDGAFEEASDCCDERWQIVLYGRPHDGVCGVEVAVGQVVAHPGDVDPRDVWFSIQQLRGDRPNGLADLDEPNPDRIEHQPVVDRSTTKMVVNRGDRRQDVLEPLIVAPAHNEMASASYALAHSQA